MKPSRALAAAVCAAALWMPQWAVSQTVSSFTVINADTGAEIATFASSGTVSITSTPRINVRANASNVKSVVFTDGTSRRTESTAPYAYKGNSGGVYAKWSPAVGTYVINAQPFAGSGGSGAAGALATLTLTVSAASVPPPSAAPTVHSFTVVNADTGTDIATFTSSGSVSILSTPNINVRANANNTKSVVFTDGTTTRIESNPPYAYKGNSGSTYTKWAPAAGVYVINAKPFASSGGTGTAGAQASFTLTVTGTAPPPPPPPPGSDRPASRNEAARFLAQATFGPTEAEIDRLMAIGYSAWIEEQFVMPRGESHQAFFERLNSGGNASDKEVGATFWKNALTGRDQLRLRMAYALSQIFVISLEDGDVDNYDRAVAAWIDMLGTHSFGNYRELLQQVSVNPMMGMYLTHIANEKADAASGRVPDENYAREVMQLFSIGLVELNQDGRPRTGADGALIETYTPADVSELAKVFTGWSWACPSWPDRGCFLRGESNGREDANRDLKPMIVYPAYHSTEAKTFLGTTIPPMTNAADSLRIALDRLAAHPNVGPFIGRQLIQRFTTSNPSAAYVSAVSSAFNNNGAGVRGDFKAVLRAVLLHPEARVINDTSGKVREPVLRLSAFMRAFPHRSVSSRYEMEITSSPSVALGQAPLHSPSVFNFYRPGYVAPGTLSAARNLVAPELQIFNETSVAGYVNFMRDNISRGVGFPAGDGLNRRDLQGDYTAELALAANPLALVDHVTTRLAYGAFGVERRNKIIEAVTRISIPASGSSSEIAAARRARVNAAILLTVAAPEFVVLK